LRTHTHTHLLHLSCHCWKHRRKASFGIFRSSAVVFDLLSSMVAKRVPLRPIFRVGNSRVTQSEIRRLRWLGDDRNACIMQFGGNGVTSGRESGFRITITHRTKHRLLRGNSSPRKAFLSSPNHRTLRMSLRVTFGCSLL